MLYEPVDEHFLERASEPLVEPRPTLSHTSSVRKPERCHDVTWLTVFALYWVGMLWIGACALQEGDPQRLVQGLDDDDQLCGEPSPPGHPQHHLESLPYVYFACLQYGQRRPTVCVSACPALSGHYVRWCAAALAVRQITYHLHCIKLPHHPHCPCEELSPSG